MPSASGMPEQPHQHEVAAAPDSVATTPRPLRRAWLPHRVRRSRGECLQEHAQVHPPSWLQRFRRNHILGPIAFSMLVIVVMPSMLGASTSRELPAHLLDGDRVPRWRLRLPLVAAVPFLRFGKHRTSNHRTTSSAMATAVDIEAETNTTTTASALERRHRTSSKSHYDFYFPLLSPHELEQYQLGADADLPAAVDRYVTAHGNNIAKARTAFDQTLEWRHEQGIDSILSRPNPKYDAVKAVIPHFFIGRDTKGHVLFVQRPGLTDPDLAKRNGLALDDLLLQYAYVFEYCWNVLHPPHSDALMTGIIDLQGINLSLLRKRELLGFVKTFVAMIDAHYPSRAYRTYMINAPGWFYTLYKVISPIMRESTKEKIIITSAGPKQIKTLEQALGKEQAALVLKALAMDDNKKANNKNSNGPEDDTESTTETDSDTDDGQVIEEPTKKKNRQWGIFPRKSKVAANTNTETVGGIGGSDLLLATDMEQEIRNFVLDRLNKEGIPMQKVVA